MAAAVPELDFKCEGDQRPFPIHGHFFRRAVRPNGQGRRPIQRRGQQAHHPIEQGLHPQVAQGAAPKAGEQGAGSRALLEHLPKAFRIGILPLQHAIGQGFI